jgi:hypothetical protein
VSLRLCVFASLRLICPPFRFSSSPLTLCQRRAHADILSGTDPSALPKGALDVARLHTALWNHSLDTVLLEETDDSGKPFKYVPKAQMERLRLDFLSYHASVFLVREEFVFAFDALESRSLNPHSGGVVVMGQPGIGMWSPPTGILMNLKCQTITKGRLPSSSTFYFSV